MGKNSMTGKMRRRIGQKKKKARIKRHILAAKGGKR
jgi:hypothetical protein